MKARLAEFVVVDHRDSSITINGEVFRWAVLDHPEAKVDEAGTGLLTITVLCENLTVIDRLGEVTRVSPA